MLIQTLNSSICEWSPLFPMCISLPVAAGEVVDLRRPIETAGCQTVSLSIMNVMSRNLIDWGRETRSFDSGTLSGARQTAGASSSMGRAEKKNTVIACKFLVLRRGRFVYWEVWLKWGN